MKPRLPAALLAVVALAVPALAQQPIDAGKSHIRFAFRQMNVPVEGRFRQFDAKVSFDPMRPESTQARFTVELGSIDLGSAEGETEARRKPWLHVESFPTATFVATKVRATGAGKFEATGHLTIKGITQTLSAPFAVTDAGGTRTVEGRFPLERLQFKVGEGAWSDTETVADEISVRFKFVIPLDP